MSPGSSHTLPAVGTEGIIGEGDLGNYATTGFPTVHGMSLSLWLQTVRFNPLLDHRTTADLPTSADVVIIGSGISGTLTAMTLLEGPNPPSSVVLLEAREFCSGATGRNAGHCKPDVWRGFAKYKKLVGQEQALKILQNEADTFEAVRSYVRQYNVDCEFWDGQTMDVLMSEELAETAVENLKEYTAAAGRGPPGLQAATDPKKAEEISRLKGAQAAYWWPGGTLHPWKLVAHICQRALDMGLNLQTWTPATKVTGTSNDWAVHTERGTIRTPTIVHATNAYIGTLLPETIGIIRPTPHTCNKVVPPSSFSGSNSLQFSYAVMFPNGAFHSINPRRNGDGAILFGGAASNHQSLLDYVAQDPKRSTDDSLSDWKPGMNAVQDDFGAKGFEWDKQDCAQGARVRYDYSWSGITARSRDRVPFVGSVPGRQGQWMCAGHNGHGMARIFTLAPALAKMIQGASFSETRIPECFMVTQERLGGLKEQEARQVQRTPARL